VSEMKIKSTSHEPERLLESLRSGGDRLSRLRELQALTDLYLDADSYDAARECIEEVLSQSAQLGLSDEERGVLLYKLARAFRAMARLPEATRKVEEARGAFRASGSREYLGKVELLSAEIALASGRYESGIRHCMVAFPLIESFGDEKDKAKGQRIAGHAHYRLGNMMECRRYFEESLELCRRIGDVEGTGKSYSDLGLLFTSRGEWVRARECLAQALEIAASSGNAVRVAIRSYNMGCLERRSGRWDLAEEYLAKSLDIFKSLEHPAGVSWALSELGILYSQKGEFDKAEEYLLGAHDIVKGHGLHREENFALVALARNRVAAGNWQDALEPLEKAVAGTKSHAPLGDLACDARTAYAECLIAAGRKEEAREQALEAVELGRSLKGRYEEGAAYRALGLVSDGVEATQAFARSLRNMRELGDDYEVARTLECFGRRLAEQPQGAAEGRKARSFLLEAHAIMDRLGAQASADALEDELASLENREGLFLRRKKVKRNRCREPQLAKMQEELESMGFVTRNGEILGQMAKWGHTRARMLIQGETGTGKEVIAKAIHEMSARKSKPYVVVDCAGISETLVESELFGHVKGAFTNAVTDREGMFEKANGGTIFLDEVGELKPAVQAKLLRVLQEGEVRRVGSSEARKVDVRVIAATNRDLEKAVERGEFRRDLFYRLKGATINLPPLRERPEDIPVLVEYFVRKQEEITGKTYLFSDEALKALESHSWAGNVRELRMETELLLESSNDCVLELEDIPAAIREKAAPAPAEQPEVPVADVQAAGAEEVLWALRRHNGNRTLAAKELGITRQALYKRLKKLGGFPAAEFQA